MSELVVPDTWRDRLESLIGRRKDSLVIVGVLVAALAVVLLIWSRGAPAAVAPPATAPPAPPSGSAAAAAATGGESGQVILVHVDGAVRRPGLYEFPMGARVADAIDAARGPLRAADLGALNLAEQLTDGQKLDVLRRGEAAPASTSLAPVPVPGSTPGTVIGLNTADQVALETIPGVGPVTATAILEYRDQVGSFTSIEQLLDVSGIGPATLESMRAYVSL